MTSYEKAKKRLGKLMSRLYKVKIIGSENVPKEGGLLVCANHTALFDPVMLGVSIDRPIHFMVKSEAMKIPIFGNFFKKLGAFPVKRGTADTKSLKTAINYLKSGECVGLFPQGTRCPGVNPRETTPKDGAIMIAHRSGADILPVYILTKKRKTRMFHKTVVIIGQVIKNNELCVNAGSPSEYNQATEMVFDKICTLGEQYSD